MTLGYVIATRITVLAIVVMQTTCMKDNNPWFGQLVDNIETFEQWSRTSEWKEHAAWLNRSIAWDIVLADTMTWAGHGLEDTKDDRERMDDMLRSGLTEVAAGPGEHVVSFVRDWRHSLGQGRCRTGTASDDDLRWIRERLMLPPPRGAGPESQQALAGYAKRASDTHDVVRVDCGGSAHLLVGVLAGKLVPIMRE